MDAEDQIELKQTCFVLKASIPRALLLPCPCRWSAEDPRPFCYSGCIRLAIRMGWRSDRGLLRHLAYAAEAVVLADWCRREEIQHLHAHFGTNPAAIALLARELSGIPYSFTAHGSEEFEKAPLLSLDTKLERAAFAVCVSSFGRSQLMRWSPPDQWRKIALVRCGVDSDFLAAVEPPPPGATVRLRRPARRAQGAAYPGRGSPPTARSRHRLRDRAGRRRADAAARRGRHPQAGLEGKISITGWVSG